MTTFFLVRHGVTTHTNHKLSGWMPDIHLTEEGRAQAEAAAEGLAGVPLKAVYASPITRTTETARPLPSATGSRWRPGATSERWNTASGPTAR